VVARKAQPPCQAVEKSTPSVAGVATRTAGRDQTLLEDLRLSRRSCLSAHHHSRAQSAKGLLLACDGGTAAASHDQNAARWDQQEPLTLIALFGNDLLEETHSLFGFFMRKILSYATPDEGPNIKLTKSQIQALRKANLWPHDREGAPYFSTGKPFRPGQPTWTDAEIQSFIAFRTHPSPHAIGR
jgi:hypothetical protein